ncbi:MAG: hypothetical protein H6673_15700 [Anaerolineales bacterium]|nr:hypothetical protein [Anaerolineales bacterium]
MEFGTEVIIAVGAAGLLAALAFRYLIETVIKLNNELQETITERHRFDEERERLTASVKHAESRLTEVERHNQQLQEQLNACQSLVEELQAVNP